MFLQLLLCVEGGHLRLTALIPEAGPLLDCLAVSIDAGHFPDKAMVPDQMFSQLESRVEREFMACFGASVRHVQSEIFPADSLLPFMTNSNKQFCALV
jgi:hypothetical protein